MSILKSAAVVVCFNPDRTAIDNLAAISQQVDFLCVVDNTLSGVTPLVAEFVAMSPAAEVLENKNRGGIAGALNLGCDNIVSKGGLDCIFLFDQDSAIPEEFVVEQVAFLAQGKADVVVPLYFDVNSASFGNYVRLDKFTFQTLYGAEASGPFRTTFAITSGTLMNTDVYRRVGQFNERYIIDHVDTEYCLRIKASGLTILVNNAVCFKHSIGKRTKHKFLGVTFKPNFHVALRRYYTARNAVLLMKEWGFTYPSLVLLLLLMNGYQIVGVLLYENHKKEKLKAFCLGFFDGILGRGGVASREFKS